MRALVFLALGLSACGGGSSATPTPPAPAEEPAASAGAERVVEADRLTLSRSGAEPRRLLRYEIPVGETQPRTIQIQMATRVSVEREPEPMIVQFPPVEVRCVVGPVEHTEAGLKIPVRVEDLHIVSNLTDEHQARLAEFEGMLAPLRELRGFVEFDPHGQTVAEQLVAPEPRQELRNFLSALRSSLRNVLIPLPPEPIGAGAVWEVVGRIPGQGIEGTQTRRFGLGAAEGDRAIVQGELSQTADPQEVVDDGVTELDTRLDTFQLEGRGVHQVELSQLRGASQYQIRVLATATTRADSGEERWMSVRTDLAVSAGPPEAFLPDPDPDPEATP